MMNDECELPVPKNVYFCMWSYFTKNMLKKSKKMRLHCAKCQKMWYMRKNPKSAGFLCSAQSHFSPGCKKQQNQQLL